MALGFREKGLQFLLSPRFRFLCLLGFQFLKAQINADPERVYPAIERTVDHVRAFAKLEILPCKK